MSDDLKVSDFGPNYYRNLWRCCLKGWRIFAQLRMAIGFTMSTMKWKAFPARKRGREHHLSTAG